MIRPRYRSDSQPSPVRIHGAADHPGTGGGRSAVAPSLGLPTAAPPSHQQRRRPARRRGGTAAHLAVTNGNINNMVKYAQRQVSVETSRLRVQTYGKYTTTSRSLTNVRVGDGEGEVSSRHLQTVLLLLQDLLDTEQNTLHL